MPDLQKINENLVSVIVPVYNGGKYIQECLESIEKQTYENFECIINNNKSTDNTLTVAEDFAKRDSRFKVFNNDEFIGQTENWNVAVSRISDKSKYIKIVPADDWIFPEYLFEMVNLMDNHPDVGICSSYRLDEREVRCDGLDYYQGPVFSGRDILYKQLIKQVEVTGSINTVMFRRSVLSQLSGFPNVFDLNSYHIDTILAYEVLNISNLGFVYKVLSFTRRHNETYTSNISEKFSTNYYANETFLYRYLHVFPSLEIYYNNQRLNYASFLIKRWLARDKECIRWHKKYLINPIKPSEYAKSILERLLLLNRIRKLSGSPEIRDVQKD